MKPVVSLICLTAGLFLGGCRSEDLYYSRALFNHIPDDPELLVLVKPNDITRLAEVAIEELKFDEFFEGGLRIDTETLRHYQNITVEMVKALGIPWDELESIGFLLYYQKPVILFAGKFGKEEMVAKMKGLGFKQSEGELFDYVYQEQKLAIPDDGLMMMAEATILEDLTFIPEERRLWNRKDFEEYRLTSPLSNSLFVWTHPPEDFLSEFKFREDLGDLSLAINFRNNVTFKSTIRIKDPKKAVYLADILIGIVKASSGFMGDDPDYGPLVRGIQISHDHRQVEASLVITADQVASLKERVVNDIQNPDAGSFGNLRHFIDQFK